MKTEKEIQFIEKEFRNKLKQVKTKLMTVLRWINNEDMNQLNLT